MIETAMIFALGFLLASLCALLILPTVNRRAARLARRRIEAALPVSAREVAAERDHLRAEFAVAQRRLERRVEAARAARQGDMAAIGARIMEAETAVTARRRSEADTDAARARADALEASLAAARAEGELGATTLTTLEEAYRDLLDDLRAARRERDRAPAETGEAAAPADRPEPGEIAILRAERDALLARLQAAEAALPEAAQLERDNADLRGRITEVAEALARRERLPAVGAFPAP